MAASTDLPDVSRGIRRAASFDGAGLYILFFLSGVSGLVYETVWLRILSRIIGNTVYATSVVLAAFMAGMALGSYLIGRLSRHSRDPLRLYALLEVGVAVTAVGLTALLLNLAPFYQQFYNLLQGNRGALTVFQSFMAFALLLVPTSLMGGTLPVLSAYTRRFGMGFAPRVGILYGLNTLGAVVGVLSSGFVLIGELGETASFLIGAALTLLVAAWAFVLSARGGRQLSAPADTPIPHPGAAISPYPPGVRRLVGIAYLLSGFASMAYEVAWTRMFQIQVGTSIYAFSLMLAFYLAGIGLGSLLGGKLLGGIRHPLRALGVAQVAIAGYSILGLYIGTLFDPVTHVLHLTEGNVLIMPLLVVFPITLVLGAMFPLVSRCYVASEADVGRAVGRLYSLNTLGCIAGSLACGFLLIGLFGTRGTILLLAAVNVAIAAAFVLAETGYTRRRMVWPGLAVVLAMLLLAAWSPDPFRVAIDRALAQIQIPDRMEIYYHQESATATTTAVGAGKDLQARRLLVNGIGMSNLCIETKLIAHLPMMLHPKPRDVLVICFGMGTTVRSVRIHKDAQCDTVELVPEVFDCFKYFHDDAAEVFADPRIQRYVDDGRNFLLVRPKKYDVINIDPAPPVWSAGTVNLYTREFFELCKERLSEEGILCLWIPPVQASEVRLIMKTFHTVYPHTQVWRAPRWPYAGFFMMGFKNPQGPRHEGFRKLAEEEAVLADLNEWAFEPPVPALDALRGLFLMSPEQVGSFVADVPLITDDHPRTEFPLWRSMFDPHFSRPIELKN